MKSSKVLKTIAFSLISKGKFPYYENVYIEKNSFGNAYFNGGIEIYTSFYTTASIYFKNNKLTFNI